MTPETSALWKSLSRSLFVDIDDAFVARFRQPGGANSRLGSWDPRDPTMRYFKFMLYTAAERQPDRFFSLYRALGKVNVGSPVSVTVRSCAINIDYLQSIEEFMFLESAIDIAAVRSVIEIGAGFGRTCHTLLALAGGGKSSNTRLLTWLVFLSLAAVCWPRSCRSISRRYALSTQPIWRLGMISLPISRSTSTAFRKCRRPQSISI